MQRIWKILKISMRIPQESSATEEEQEPKEKNINLENQAHDLSPKLQTFLNQMSNFVTILSYFKTIKEQKIGLWLKLPKIHKIHSK